MKKTKLAYMVSHPIQYQAPLLRYITENSDIDLTALFMSDFSVREYHDKEFGTTFQWDVPLLEGYKHQFLPVVGSRDSIENPKPFVPGMKRILMEGGFDALWTHGYAHQNTLRALLSAKSLGIKTMVRAESQWGSAAGTGLKRQLKNSYLKKLFGKIDAFLCIGSANKDYYRSFGVEEERMHLVPYAVDNLAFQAKAATAQAELPEFLAKHNIAPGQPVILYASKLTKRKRIMDLCFAYDLMMGKHTSGPKPILMIVGDGEMRPELEAWMAEKSYDSVRFLGFQNQSQLPVIFAATSIFVLASEREPWGLVVNEVMNAKVPVLVSHEVGSHFDLVEEGKTGFVIQTGDIEATADRLSKVCYDPDLQKKMGQLALEKVSNWGYAEDLAGIESALNYLGFPGHNGLAKAG